MSAIFISACGDENSFSATDSPIESSSSIEYIEPTINSSADSDSVESSSKHTISSSSTTTVSSSSIESSNSNEVTSSSSTKEDTVVVSSSSTKEDTVVVSSSSTKEDTVVVSSSSNNNKEESSSSMENDVESSSSNELDVLSSSSSSEKLVESSSSELVVSSSSEKNVESSSSSELVESSSSEEIVNSSSSVDEDEDYVDENEEKSTIYHYVEADDLKLNEFRVENNIAYLSWENNTDYTMQINVTYSIGCNIVSIADVGVVDTTIMYTIKANSVKEKAIYEIKNNAETCIGEIKAITATENDKSNFVDWKKSSDRGLESIIFGNY